MKYCEILSKHFDNYNVRTRFGVNKMVIKIWPKLVKNWPKITNFTTFIFLVKILTFWLKNSSRKKSTWARNGQRFVLLRPGWKFLLKFLRIWYSSGFNEIWATFDYFFIGLISNMSPYKKRVPVLDIRPYHI